MIEPPKRDPDAPEPVHFLNDYFGKVFTVPDYVKPMPDQPEVRSTAHLHIHRKQQSFELRNMYEPDEDDDDAD